MYPSEMDETSPFQGIQETISPIHLEDLDADGNGIEFNSLVERLTINNELQKLLSDEKMRSETHKGNYQHLKTQFIKLIHESKFQAAELVKLQDENRNLEKILMASKEENHKLKQDYDAQIEKLTNQVPTEGQLLALEQRVKTSNDNAWLSRIHDTMDDLEASKLTVQQLIKENLCLRHIHTHSVEDHQQEIQEMTLNFQGKIKHLEKMVQDMEDNKRPVLAAMESDAIKQSLENSKLQEKIKFLEKSLDESERARKDSEDRFCMIKRKSAEENTKNNALISKLRAEKTSLEKTLSSNEEEMKKYKSESLSLRQLLESSQIASNDVENKIRESLHSVKEEMELTKLEFAKEKTVLTCEKDFIRKQFEDLKLKYENLSSSKCILEQETENLRHSMDIQKAEDKTVRAEKIALLEVKNSELEMKIKNLDQMNTSLKIEKESSDSEIFRRLEERELMMKDISSLSKDIVFFQSELDRLHSKEKLLEDELKTKDEENRVLKKELLSHEDQSTKCHNYSKLIKKLRNRLEESNTKIEAFERLATEPPLDEMHLHLPQTSPSSHTSINHCKTDDEMYHQLKLRYQDLKTRHKKFSKLLRNPPLEKI